MEPPRRSKIRVITVRNELIDLMHASVDEIDALCDAENANKNFGSTAGVKALGAFFRSPVGPLLARRPRGGAPIEAVLLRELLANPAVRPVVADVSPRGHAAAPPYALTSRASTSVQAFDGLGRAIAFAAEEQMSVIGLAVGQADSGLMLMDALGSSHDFGISVCATSGAYSAEQFAVLCAQLTKPPLEAPDTQMQSDVLARALKAQHYVYLSFQEGRAKVLAAVLAQTSAALEFYMGGAATALSAAAIAAAAAGERVGPVAIAQAFQSPVLQLFGTRVSDGEEPAPSLDIDPPALVDRRRYLIESLSRIIVTQEISGTAQEQRLVALSEIWNAGASDAYLAVLTEGRESARLAEFIERLTVVTARHVATVAAALATASKVGRARQLVSLIEERLGAKRMREIVAALGASALGAPGGRLSAPGVSGALLGDPTLVLALLTRGERALIELEAKNRAAAAAAAAGNRCPHVRLARKLASAPTARERLQALDDLLRVYVAAAGPPARGNARAAPDARLICRSCGEPAVCPHLRDRVRLEARGAPYAEVRAALEVYALRTGGDSSTYYCRICAEQLAAADAPGDEAGRAAAELGRFGELGAGLRTRVWALTLSVLRRVRFAVPTDERHFAGAAATALVPLVELAAAAAPTRQPRRRRDTGALTNAAELREELPPRTELLAAIYVYAYVLNALQGTESSFAGSRPGERASMTAEKMLGAIATEKSAELAQLEDASTEYLRAQFTAAFRAVRAQGGAPAQPDHAAEFATTMTTIDPVYRYAVSAARSVGDLPLEPPTTASASRHEFELVMGASLQALIVRARAAAREPDLAGLFAGRPGLLVPPDTTYEFWLKSPRVTLYTSAMYSWPTNGAERDASIALFYEGKPVPSGLGIKYWMGGREKARKKAHEKTHEPSHEKTHEQNTKAGASAEAGAYFEAWRLLVQYSTNVYNEAGLTAYNEELLRYRNAEGALRLEHAFRMSRASAKPRTGRSQAFVRAAVVVSQLYDEAGEPHDWGKKATYYYAQESQTENTLTFKGVPAVMAARASGALPAAAALTDVGCAICGIRRSAVGTLDAAKVAAAVRAISEVSMFFLYYESRCPVGGIHDWVGAGACKQCGLDPAAPRAPRSAAARAYYTKYREVFAKDRSLPLANVRDLATPTEQNKTLNAPAKVIEAASAWEPDYSRVTSAAALIGTTAAVFEAIGASSGRPFAEIAEGTDSPPPPELATDPRIKVADATTRAYFAEYLLMRRGPLAGPALQNLFTEAAIPAEDQARALADLPDPPTDYCEVFSEVLRSRTPAIALSFAIQSLCEFAVTLAAASALGTAAAKNILTQVVQGVRRMSKPGVFDWGIFSGERILDEEDEDDPDQVGDVGEDIQPAEVADDDPNPFSGENIDYDTSEDNPNNAPE